MDLKAKYGDEKVWVVRSDEVKTYSDGPFFDDDQIDFCIKNGEDKLRYEVENDPSYKQIIPYAIVTDDHYHYFCTHRLAGDGRLTGKYSIGTGGHMKPGETLTEALFRELNEEVGITPDDMTSIIRTGYILDNSSEVNSVHLGVVYIIGVNNTQNVVVQEKEKLSGEWIDGNTLATLFNSDALESWSEYVYKNCI